MEFHGLKCEAEVVCVGLSAALVFHDEEVFGNSTGASGCRSVMPPWPQLDRLSGFRGDR